MVASCTCRTNRFRGVRHAIRHPTDSAARHQRLACLVRASGVQLQPPHPFPRPAVSPAFPIFPRRWPLSPQFLRRTVPCLRLKRCHSIGSRRPRDHAPGLTATVWQVTEYLVTGDSARARQRARRAEPYPPSLIVAFVVVERPGSTWCRAWDSPMPLSLQPLGSRSGPSQRRKWSEGNMESVGVAGMTTPITSFAPVRPAPHPPQRSRASAWGNKGGQGPAVVMDPVMVPQILSLVSRSRSTRPGYHLSSPAVPSSVQGCGSHQDPWIMYKVHP
jgi:hypothetical protein